MAICPSCKNEIPMESTECPCCHVQLGNCPVCNALYARGVNTQCPNCDTPLMEYTDLVVSEFSVGPARQVVTSPKNEINKNLLRIIVCIIIILLCLLGMLFFYFSRPRSENNADDTPKNDSSVVEDAQPEDEGNGFVPEPDQTTATTSTPVDDPTDEKSLKELIDSANNNELANSVWGFDEPYGYVMTSKTWEEANDYCESLNQENPDYYIHLATIESLEEFQNIQQMLRDFNTKRRESGLLGINRIWVGAKKEDNQTWKDRESVKWINGQGLDVIWDNNLWFSNGIEPSDVDSSGNSATGIENCLLLWYSNGTWSFNTTWNDCNTLDVAKNQIGFLIECEKKGR